MMSLNFSDDLKKGTLEGSNTEDSHKGESEVSDSAHYDHAKPNNPKQNYKYSRKLKDQTPGFLSRTTSFHHRPLTLQTARTQLACLFALPRAEFNLLCDDKDNTIMAKIEKYFNTQIAEYGVSWYTRMAKVRDGTCTSAKSDPEDIVVRRARYLLHHGFGDYDVIKNNCEDFALYCKLGRLISGDKKATSGQVLSFLRAPAAVIVSSPLRLFMPPPVTLVTTVVMYSLDKYESDMGVRDDLIEVEVEELAKFRANSNQLKE
ncbi:hypothetical protein RD792_005580 [Penstemon davidsonii]|uniref:LRAT domain-containing protein n=1 Tax=Penstemon davidsonii TaxID=160366 RepID=A0ABR0DEV4_9LAMI|nr:hypothetical protein RD792_005580 [Penstemon davidsonii]